MKNLISMLVKVGISGAILYLLFRNIDLELFWATVKSANKWTIVLSAVIIFGTQAISSFRWQTILKKDMFVPYKKLLSIYLVGMFFNNFLPTMVGGDVIKGYYLYKASGRGDLSLASIFMDRYSGFTAMMVLTTGALVLGFKLLEGTGLAGMFVLLIASFVGMSLVIWVGPLHGWAMSILSKVHFYGLNKKIDTTYRVLMSYKSHLDILVTIFLCSMVIQAGVIIGYYILGLGLGIEGVGLGYYFLFIPLATVVSMLPISLAGLGIREGAFVYLFTLVGASTEQALTLSLMWFALMVLVSVLGGFEYVRMGGKKDLLAAGGPEAPFS
jgi:uncharacterized protein (TIRG00374 family)